MSASPTHFQYAAYLDPVTNRPQIGHYDFPTATIQPLTFSSGTPLTSLYQVIEAGSGNIIRSPAGPAFPAANVQLLPPIAGRDVLAVGKNYLEHAHEFNNSGFDSSDKVARPSHPVIFTKRATSIVAHGTEILPHPDFTDTLDYEGELGVIIGKTGFRIGESEAMDHVWGYTVINDVTARERQRDHKQFFIGKSADTFCPMGPIAVQKENLPAVLRVQTHVNGELRQNATTDDLIFSIPTLIKVISEGITIQPGDVIATGTPAGVGIGKTPPVYLKPNDEVAVSITGLGTLKNRIASPSVPNTTAALLATNSCLPITNASKTLHSAVGLTTLPGLPTPFNYQTVGSGPPMVFVHGLGATLEYWGPLIATARLTESHTCHLFDFEGHGLSPTPALSRLTISSLAASIAAVFAKANVSAAQPAILIAHSLGCLAALEFALANQPLVHKLILLGPPPSPLDAAGAELARARAALVRRSGMAAVVDAVVCEGLSAKANPVAVAAVRCSLMGQDPEAYAKGCEALAGADSELAMEGLKVSTLIVTGDEDQLSPLALCEGYGARMEGAKVVVLPGVGHWHVFEDAVAVAKAVQEAL